MCQLDSKHPAFSPPRKEMPVETIPAAKFMMEKLLGEITSSKVYPVKLSGVKHQDELCSIAKLVLY